jgi:hypothetical protein
VVNAHAGAVGHPLELRERDVEAVARRIRAWRDQHVAAAQRPAVDAGQRDGDAATGLGTRDVLVVHLDAADAHVHAARLRPQDVAGRDRPGPERPGRDRSDAGEREHAVDRQSRRADHRLPPPTVGGTGERSAKVVEAGAGPRADRHDLGLRHELARLLDGQLERLGVDGVRLRDGDHAVVDAEQPYDGEVLVGLRARPLGRVHDEQEQVDTGGASHHRPYEALVTGHVHERQAPAVR